MYAIMFILPIYGNEHETLTCQKFELLNVRRAVITRFYVLT